MDDKRKGFAKEWQGESGIPLVLRYSAILFALLLVKAPWERFVRLLFAQYNPYNLPCNENPKKTCGWTHKSLQDKLHKLYFAVYIVEILL